MIKIKDFLKDFVLDEDNKEHIMDLISDTAEIICKLRAFSPDVQNEFLLNTYYDELVSSSKLEGALYSPEVLKVYEEEFANDDKLTEGKLFILHKAILKNEEKRKTPGKYRDHTVWIGNPNEGIENAFHLPPEADEIDEYMKDFIEFYNDPSNELDNPFVKGALAHMIFIKIHPFSDGNGRMARILQNHKLRSIVNHQCGMKFTFPILNISRNYDLTRLMYFKRQNQIKFDDTTDNNEAINKWVGYVLTMYDEQSFYLNNELDNLDPNDTSSIKR